VLQRVARRACLTGVLAAALALAGRADGPAPPQTPAAPAPQQAASQAATQASPPAPAPPPGPPAWLEPLWTVKLPGEPVSSPAYDATQSYIPLRDNRLIAVVLETGQVRWTVEAGPPILPVAGDGFVFVAGPRIIEARDRENGSVKWRVALDGTASGPPLWDDGWLLAVTDQGDGLALLARDGAMIWKRALGAPARVAPSLGGDHAYFPLDDGRVVSVALRTGAPIWERSVGGQPSRLLVVGDRVYVGSADNFFYCLDASNGKVHWRWRTGGDVIGLAAVDTKAVYFVSLDNLMRALDRGSGSQRWKVALLTRPTGGPLLFDDTLLLVSGIAADVRAHRTKDGGLAAEFAAPAELAAPPYVTPPGTTGNVLLVVVTREGQVQALGLAPIGHPIQGLPMFVGLPAIEGTRPPEAVRQDPLRHD